MYSSIQFVYGNCVCLFSFNYSTFILHTFHVPVSFFWKKTKTKYCYYSSPSILRSFDPLCISLDLIYYYYCYIPLSGNTRLQRYFHHLPFRFICIVFSQRLHRFVISNRSGTSFFTSGIMLLL